MSDLNNDFTNKKKPLGRGLGSLLGGHQRDLSAPETTKPSAPNAASIESAEAAAHPFSAPPTTPVAGAVPMEARIWQISIDKLAPSTFQPRTHFEKEALADLAQSIKENGILQPIIVRRLPNGKFEIIAGERRWRAAQIAGIHEVPAIVKNSDDKSTLELAIIENIQREQLNPLEEAEAYQRLVTEFHLTQQQVAEKVGKERATVANALRLLQLPKEVRELVTTQQLSAGHAKVLLSVQNPEKLTELAKKAVKDGLSVRKLEKLALQNREENRQNEASEVSVDTNVTQRLISSIAQELQKRLGTKVSIDYKDSKGKISIQFYSDEELTQIVDRLKGECPK